MLHAVVLVQVGITAAAAKGPCDIYQAHGTPCVAAHSVVRALYAGYTGPLYEVTRYSGDNATKDIGVADGGFADAAAQDAFCNKALCRITRIYDQSPKQNHLGIAPPGGAARHADLGVNATQQPLKVGGHPVYAAVFDGGNGYRNETTTGVATGDEPESMYAVVAGKHFNNKCCFDYGNAWVLTLAPVDLAALHTL